MSESLINIVKSFDIEGVDNCEVARLGGEQSIAVLVGHNEGEPHRMSPEMLSISKPSLSTVSEGRWAGTVVNLGNKRGQNDWRSCIVLTGSAGVACQEVMLEEVGRPLIPEQSVSVTRGARLKSGNGIGGVGVLHSSDEDIVMMSERRRGTWSMQTKK